MHKKTKVELLYKKNDQKPTERADFAIVVDPAFVAVVTTAE